MNSKWRALNAPGFGPEVINFNRRLREKELISRKHQIFKQKLYVRQLLRRFPEADAQYLQELYPEVNIKDQKENLDEYVSQNRWLEFHSQLYKPKKE